MPVARNVAGMDDVGGPEVRHLPISIQFGYGSRQRWDRVECCLFTRARLVLVL